MEEDILRTPLIFLVIQPIESNLRLNSIKYAFFLNSREDVIFGAEYRGSLKLALTSEDDDPSHKILEIY